MGNVGNRSACTVGIVPLFSLVPEQACLPRHSSRTQKLAVSEQESKNHC